MDIVVGGGKYGVEAAEYLRKNNRAFVIIDRDPECLAAKKLKLKKGLEGKENLVVGDLQEVLELVEKLNPEFVFPTAPMHVAAELLKIKFNLNPDYDSVNCILSSLPLKVVVSVGKGSVVVSYNRDKECLPKCSAPDVCPVTKIKKPCPMYELVKFAIPDGLVLISHQLEPGIGALKGDELKELFHWAKKRIEGDGKIAVATACKCHGIITALIKV
jgi:hypothetical protein